MKATTILSLLSVAMSIIAAPVMDTNALEARTGSTCTADGQKPVCCDVLLKCVVQVVGATCTTSSYCCETKSAVGGLVSINALNCAKIL